MTIVFKSTIDFRSNLQALSEWGFDDLNYLGNIHDPFALEILKKSIDMRLIKYRLSDIQQKEYKQASLHCAYAAIDDYPWGTYLVDGAEKVVCRCLNIACLHFEKCRPDFDESELNVLDANKNRSFIEKNYLEDQQEANADIISRTINIQTAKTATKEITEIKKVETQSKEPPTEPETDIRINKGGNFDTYYSEETAIVNFESFITVEQEKVINDESDKRIIVNAGPGTGKTWTLIEKLIYLVNSQNVEPNEIVVLCFSRAAVEVITKRLKQAADDERISLNWSSIEIRTFDSFATRLLAYVQENENELLHEHFNLAGLDYDSRIRTAADVIRKNHHLVSQCRHLIVDEVQDLVSVRADLIIQMITSIPEESGFTLLGDACQSIYDYQVSNGEMDSIKFYSWMFNNLHGVSYYKFEINYRQKSSIENIGNKYRRAILAGSNKERQHSTDLLCREINDLDWLNLKKISLDDLKKIKGSGNLGILTRTNAQALKISTWLRNADIAHKVQRRMTDNGLADWIGRFFCAFKNDTIGADDFRAIYNSVCHLENREDISLLWKAIINTLNRNEQRFRVTEILQGIKEAKENIFYSGIEEAEITVSNIHRSKGREFDNVLLINDILIPRHNGMSDLQEDKVRYVAITRAMGNINRVKMENHHMYIDKAGDGRSYQTGWGVKNNKSSLTHIEIGRSYDLDPKSFAEDIKIQNMIRDQNIVGERVQLIKNKSITSYIAYDIVLEDIVGQPRIGRTSHKFYRDLGRIIKNVKNLPWHSEVFEYLYPNRLSDMYVDGIITIIDNADNNLEGATQFGDIMIWIGITLIGFAHLERDRY